MWIALMQRPVRKGAQSLATTLRHLGALGLFFLAILDSSPLPTFGGPDILTAILAASRRNPWWEYAVVATAGSVIGAYLTFRLARGAGQAYLETKFKKSKVERTLEFFKKWSVGALFASTAVPFPFPTSMLFAAAGVSKYRTSKFLTIVTVGRAIRYGVVALVADHYGRHFIRALRHPGQYWIWLLVGIVLVSVLVTCGILMTRGITNAEKR